MSTAPYPRSAVWRASSGHDPDGGSEQREKVISGIKEEEKAEV